jgi:Poxvirus A32 protein
MSPGKRQRVENPSDPQSWRKKAQTKKKPKKNTDDECGEQHGIDEEALLGGMYSGLPQGSHYEQVDTHGLDLSIKQIETSKDQIEQPELAKDPRKIIPSLGHSIIINGKSGCGKSTLLANYVTGPAFFGKSEKKPNGWFDKIFLFSPTAGGDDVQQALGIPKKHVYTNLDEAPELLEIILRTQKEKLDGGGKAHKVEQYLVIFDDVIGDSKFMGTKEFMKTFYMVRHCNCTTIICSQHYKKVPKVCRLQAGFIHFFAGSQAEVDQIVEDFAPSRYTKNEFRAMVADATREDHSFLTVCMKVGEKDRFRRGLTDFIRLERLGDDEGDGSRDDKNEEKKDKDKEKEGHQQGGGQSKHKDPPGPGGGAGSFSGDTTNEFQQNLKNLTEFFLRRHNERKNEQAGRQSRQRLY